MRRALLIVALLAAAWLAACECEELVTADGCTRIIRCGWRGADAPSEPGVRT